MLRLKWFVLGAASLCVVALIVGLVVISQSHGFSARAQPTGIERWMARLARSVNTVGLAESGWWGESTDGVGFVDLLEDAIHKAVSHAPGVILFTAPQFIFPQAPMPLNGIGRKQHIAVKKE